MSPIDHIEPWRAQLLKLAEYHMGPRLRQKLGAEDVVQDAIIHALNAWSNFRGNPEHRHELGAWLRKILVNEVLENYRRFSTLGRDFHREMSLLADAEKSYVRLGQAAQASMVSPPDYVMRQERSEQLHRALARLPCDQAHAVAARYFDCLKIREIAERLRMTDKMAADRVGRGLSALMKIMGEL